MSEYPNVAKWEKKAKSIERNFLFPDHTLIAFSMPKSKVKSKMQIPNKPKKHTGLKPVLNLPAPKATRSHIKRNKILKDINDEHFHDLNFDDILNEANENSIKFTSNSHSKYLTPEQFVQANYKLVANPKIPDLKENFFIDDSNKLFDWKYIEQIIYPLSENSTYSCPICNETEILAPRITKCGHVFCFPCILRYLQYRIFYYLYQKIEKTNMGIRKCPLCYEIIEEDDIKIAKILKTKCLSEGDVIEFHLTVRNKNSIVVHDIAQPENNSLIFSNKNTQFTRLSLCYDFTEVYQPQITQLENALNKAISDNDTESQIFIETALFITKDIFEVKKQILLTEDQKNAENYIGKIDAKIPDNNFYVYQISTGENMYLLPLDFKILQDTYDSNYSIMPKIIKAKILEITHYQLNSSQRKKYKYF